jgi:hypothetical protein
VKNALLFMLALAVAFPSIADTLKTEDDLRPFTDQVMDGLFKADTATTLRKMRPYVALSDSEFEGLVAEATTTRDKYRNAAGKQLGFDFFSQKQMGDSMTRLTYGERAKQLRLTWIFFFSKTADGWILNNFHAR